MMSTTSTSGMSAHGKPRGVRDDEHPAACDPCSVLARRHFRSTEPPAPLSGALPEPSGPGRGAWRKRSFVALAVAALFAVSPAALASDRLPSKPFVYDANQAALVDVLRDFAGLISTPIVIAEGVTGTVNAKFSIAPRAFLDLISRSSGLIWYHDGSALYIYPSSEIQSRIYRLSSRQAKDVIARLASFGLLDQRYPVRLTGSGGASLLITSGPPRHIEVLDALLEALNSDAGEGDPPVIRTFRLTHASAVDRKVKGVAVVGLATRLNQFFGGASGEGSGAGAQGDAGPYSGMVSMVTESSREMLATQAALVGGPDSRARRQDAVRDTVNTLKSGGAAPTSTSTGARKPLLVNASITDSGFAQTAPRIVADEASNSLMVQAPEALIGEIAAMIARLDVPRDMIEVEATIIDVSSDEIESLGFDWRFSGNAMVRSAEVAPAVATTTSSGAIPQGGGFTITTLLASGGKELLARIRALEARGTARVISQPKVLGAANHTAVLADRRTASVRVAGNQDARLYSVETGTTLQVTPRIIQLPQQTRIALELDIEDGGFSTQTVDNVPIAQRTSISTIATLVEGQALLVGGIEVEGASSGKSGIPGLSSLPVVGALFRFDSSQGSRRQRLFLITPKRVTLDMARADAPVAPVLPATPASLP